MILGAHSVGVPQAWRTSRQLSWRGCTSGTKDNPLPTWKAWCHPEHERTIRLAKQGKTKVWRKTENQWVYVSVPEFNQPMREQATGIWVVEFMGHLQDPFEGFRFSKVKVRDWHQQQIATSSVFMLVSCRSIQHHLKWLKHCAFDGMNDLS